MILSKGSEFPHLLAPGRIGPVELRNRIVLAAMGSYMGGADGQISERHTRFYEERAKGGAGLITTEVAAVDYPRGAAMTHQLGISNDAFVPGLRDLCERVHAHGAKIAVQLHHGGKVAVKDLAEGRPLSVPSASGVAMEGVLEDLTREERVAVTRPYTGIDPGNLFHELEEDEILRLISCYGDAARRAQQAGFDAVEVHAGHGYLIDEFLSRRSNHRKDRWGGVLENRARLLVEVLRDIRKKVGDELGVWCRLNGSEAGLEDGIRLEDAVETARIAERAGADAIHVSCYGGPSGKGFSAMIVQEPGALLPYAEAIKRAIRVPVIAVGRLTPEAADRAVAEGRADFVAMARPLLADPELPRKLQAGRRNAIRPCIYCYRCVGQIFLNERVRCAVNPAVANEAEFEVEAADPARSVLVIGGGPAGMEAARVAAERGHRVTLCDQERRLGGTLLVSSIVYPANGDLVGYYETILAELGVELRLGAPVTRALIERMAPDVVLVAVGARRERPALPPISDAGGPRIFDGDALRQLLTGSGRNSGALPLSLSERCVLGLGRWLLGRDRRPERVRRLSRLWMPLGQRVAIIGAGLVGLELAEFLAERGRAVTVLEAGPDLGPEMAIPRRWWALAELREHQVELLTQVELRSFEPDGIEVVAADGGARRIPADDVVIATGTSADDRFTRSLEGLDCEVHTIGDAARIGYIEGAILAGASVARDL